MPAVIITIPAASHLRPAVMPRRWGTKGPTSGFEWVKAGVRGLAKQKGSRACQRQSLTMSPS